jgi:hypothetical protein
MAKLTPHHPPVFGRGWFTPAPTPAPYTQTAALAAELRRLYVHSQLAAPDLIDQLTNGILARALANRALPDALTRALVSATRALVAIEAPLFTVPPLAHTYSIARAVAQRTELRQRLAFFDNHQPLIAEWLDGLAQMLTTVIARIPPLPAPDPTSLILPVPLTTLIREPARLIADLITTALHFTVDPELDRNTTRPGAQLADRIMANLLRASRLSLSDAHKRPERLNSPLTDTADANTLIERYLGGTPLAALAQAPLPLAITQATRFEHCNILAATGHGKTQTMQHLIVGDLKRPPALVPSMVVIDSKGDMLRKISRLALFDPQRGAIAGRLIIIDPTDIDHPPGLNLFDLNTARIATYGRAAQEQILNSVIELYDYIFGGLLAADMTQKQRLVFRYLARLIIQIPNANIHTLRQLLDPTIGNDLYQAHADRLTPAIRAFFETEFLDKQYLGTRRQVLRRLWGILENPTLERALSADKNRVDLFAALNRGAIVLVNTARDFLKDEKSSFLGRIFIALTLQAIFERAALPEAQRRPTFLYIDEASEYFDDKIDDLLVQARQHRCGIVLAHQYLDQLSSPALKASIAANTAIKLAGGVADEDARALAPNMRTTPEFIARHTKTNTAASFAIYVRNVTPAAVTLTVPFGTLEAQPRMSDAAYARLIAGNRARLSSPTSPPSDPQPVPMPSQPPPRGKLRAGAQEHILLPEHKLTLTAKLDTQAIGLCAMHVLSLERLQRNANPFVRFTLAALGGARVTLERQVIDTAAVDPFGGTTVDCPVITLRFKIAHHDLTERFALAVNHTSEVLLGQPVLTGRFIVDSEETFLLGHAHSTPDNQPTDHHWRS